MAYWDFLQMTPENQAAARNMSWGQAIKSEIPGTSNYRGYNPFYKGADATGLGGYLKQGGQSLAGNFQAGSNVGGATPLMRKLAMSPVARGIGTVGRVAGLANPVGVGATAAYVTPKLINKFTEREDPNITGMYGLNIKDLEKKAAEYDYTGEGKMLGSTLEDWGFPSGKVPVAGDDIQETVTSAGVFPESENLIPPFMEEPSGVGEGYDKQGLWDRIKGAPLGIINALTRRQGATESFGGYPGGAESRAGLFPREVQNLQRLADQNRLGRQGQDVFGTNVVSQFGDYDKAMDKNLGVFEKTMAQKGYKDLDELEEYYSKTYGPKSYILNKLRHVKGWQGQGPKDTRDIPDAGGGWKPTPGRDYTSKELSNIGRAHYTGPGMAFEARPSGTFTTPSGERGYSGGRATGGYIRSGYSKGGRVGILSIF